VTRAQAAADKDKLAVLAKLRGLKGLTSAEIQRKLGLSLEETLSLAQALEAEGRVLILTFYPLRLLARGSLDFLREKIRDHITRYHRQHPCELGLPKDKLQKRFVVPRRILSLTVRSLLRDGEVVETEGRLHLADFQPSLLPREEKLLAELEIICLRGDFDPGPLEEFRAKHHLAAGELDRLMSILVSRRKVVRGRNGLYLHSQWLEEVVSKVRSVPGGELSVADFKRIIGLSRKYAIPLLELLDQMGITRRKGSRREILEPHTEGEDHGP
jgi:selenocysteine-specific elongation factor